MKAWPFRVLLVDDVVDLRRLMRDALEATGDFTVVGEAGDGVEAVELAKEVRPDAVLLDLSMPRMDGLEALPRILEASPLSKVVVLSGFARPRLDAAAKAAGAALYIEKGTPPDEILRELRRVLADARRR